MNKATKTSPTANATTIVAEIGCNHKGSMETLHEMIRSAADFAHVDYIKLQKRCNRELLTQQEYDAPHPNPINSFGESYGAHREFLEFDVEQHRDIMAMCKDIGVGYATSVWDLTSAREIASLAPDFIKIPSACNLHMPILDHLANEYEGGIHISLGMTTLAEQDAIIERLRRAGAAQRVVLYSCTSGYPVAHEDVCLLEIGRLRERYGKEIAAVGFSGHHLGIAVDIAAIALGASWVERHFTLDRTWKGTDHAASLEPDGLRRLVRDARVTQKALAYKSNDILEVEIEQRNKLKRLPGVHFQQ